MHSLSMIIYISANIGHIPITSLKGPWKRNSPIATERSERREKLNIWKSVKNEIKGKPWVLIANKNSPIMM